MLCAAASQEYTLGRAGGDGVGGPAARPRTPQCASCVRAHTAGRRSGRARVYRLRPQAQALASTPARRTLSTICVVDRAGRRESWSRPHLPPCWQGQREERPPDNDLAMQNKGITGRLGSAFRRRVPGQGRLRERPTRPALFHQSPQSRHPSPRPAHAEPCAHSRGGQSRLGRGQAS